jgi:nucleotide-binding universal stress UspA family protein
MKILIPLDGSKFAEAVLEPAAQLAARSTAEVHLIRVVNPLDVRRTRTQALSSRGPGAGTVLGAPPETIRQSEEWTLRAAEEYLNQVANSYFPYGAVKKAVVGPNPAEDILSYAQHEQVNLIAIATHGRTGMARSMMGGVAAAFINEGLRWTHLYGAPTRVELSQGPR